MLSIWTLKKIGRGQSNAVRTPAALLRRPAIRVLKRLLVWGEMVLVVLWTKLGPISMENVFIITKINRMSIFKILMEQALPLTSHDIDAVLQ